MQLFGRPLARAVCRNGNARFALQPPARLPQLLGLAGLQTLQQPLSCLQSRPKQAIGAPLRHYSSQPPSKESTTSSSPNPIVTPAPTPTSTPPPGDGSESSSSSTAKDEPTPPPKDDTPPRERLDLPSYYESRRAVLTQKFSEAMDTLQTRVLTASQTLNQVTGYDAIESIKADNDRLESQLAEAHARLRTARHTYKTSNAQRATTQREVTTLLARKESWTPTDLERFTELYRADHVLEGEVSAAQETLTEAEAEEQSLGQRLSAGILKRYHEEQVWSDRIRRASTWGTWGLMGMNFLTFLILQFVAEPWRRRRLVNGVVAEEERVLGEVREELLAIKAELQASRESRLPDTESSYDETLTISPSPSTTAAAAEVITEPVSAPGEAPEAPVTLATPDSTPPISWEAFLSDPKLWRVAFEDLWSDRHVDLRMRDASVLALEGAVAGATVAAAVIWGLTRR